MFAVLGISISLLSPVFSLTGTEGPELAVINTTLSLYTIVNNLATINTTDLSASPFLTLSPTLGNSETGISITITTNFNFQHDGDPSTLTVATDSSAVAGHNIAF